MPQAIPIVLAVTAIAGIGLQVAGTVRQSQAAAQTAAAEQRIALQQQRQEQLRRQAMELDARRRQLQNIRQAQVARQTAVAIATNQGANFGSAIPGAEGQISGQFGTNTTGIYNNLDIGRGIFDSNSAISGQRYNIAGYQSDYATGAGLSSLGGALIGSLGTVGRLSGGFGGSSNSGGFGYASSNAIY